METIFVDPPDKPVKVSLVLKEQFIVIGVASDPEPDYALGFVHSERAITDANPDRPKLLVFANLFELKGSVRRVYFEKLKILISELLNLFR